MDTTLLRKLNSKIQKFILKERNQSLGIYTDETGIFCTQLYRDNSGYLKIEYAERIDYAGDTAEDRQYGIDELKNSFLKAGITAENMIICLPEECIYYYHKTFPVLEAAALQDAVHWDIASNVPFTEEYLEGYFKDGAEKNKYLLGAVDKSTVDSFRQSFSLNDMNIKSMVSAAGKDIEVKIGSVAIGDIECQLPDHLADYFTENGQLLALYAAVTEFSALGLEFSAEKKQSICWNYLNLSACVLFLSFITAGGVLGTSLWQLHDMESALAAEKQEFALLSEVWEGKQHTAAMNEKYKSKADVLQKLKKYSWPVYAILVHLGCNTGEGTWLTDISAEKGCEVLLKGEAVSYNSLVKYYQLLVADKEFFTGGVVLEKSDLSADGRIAFSIRLKL